MKEFEKPKATWHCFIPFSKTRSVYKRDLERYEEQFLDHIGKIRLREHKAINEMSALLICLATLLLTIVPWFASSLPHQLAFLKLGLAPTGKYSWADHLMAFATPAVGGAVVHKVPAMIPGKVGKIINIIAKIIPILLLIIYLFNRERDVLKIKKVNRQEFKDQFTAGELVSDLETDS
ncbi:hypothetical protein LD119_00710 [Mesoplasma sp. JKS002660]|uniref:hypothetical protein n=1 Tax=Mesoplasma whartonense TaxID=2878854 RepID=UPI002022B333|nr:hypothetical protein [Mesoplasma sp. JKS002660]MCL8213759.1 hypothetical protein [Mesoplasma sp. JKS002660]